MNTELFIASRIIRAKKTPESTNISGTRPIVRIAIGGISLGLAVMILAVAIVTGFQTEIRDKVSGFGGHIRISSYDSNTSLEPSPIPKDQAFYPYLDTVSGIRHIQVYATKAGIIKTDKEIEGVVVKGVGSDFDWQFFERHMVAGNPFKVTDTSRTNEVILSQQIARNLKLDLGDKIYVYFIQEQQQRARVFTLSGIYKTGLEEYDKRFMLADIGHIQKLNDWEENQVGGFEVLLDNFEELNEYGDYIYAQVGYDLNAQTIKEIHPQLFDWLQLQDLNVVVIIVLMILVAGINMISALLIMIIERVNMIGILKALGMENSRVREIFLYNGAYLTALGLLFGNILGIGLCLLQYHFGIITLPEESYYVKVVPINLQVGHVLLLNLGSFLLCVLMLLIPSYLVSRITPLRAIRYN